MLPEISWKFHENTIICFAVMLLTDRQTYSVSVHPFSGSPAVCLPVNNITGMDGQKNRQTDRQTDRQTSFYPRPVMAFGYCRCLRLSVCVCVCMCVCVSVNHQFVRTITCHPLKLQSPNLDQKCKTPWLRSLLFLGFIDLDLQGQIELKSQNLPHFGLVSLSERQVNTKWSEAFQIWTKNAP